MKCGRSTSWIRSEGTGDRRPVSATLPGIRAELAAAVRAVNAAYNRLPESRRPDVTGWNALDRAVDEACAAGDRDRALQAIDEWRDSYLAACSKAASEGSSQ